jgi:hypothetical protein
MAGPSIDATNDLGERYTQSWIAVRDGSLKLYEVSDGARWAADLASATGEVLLPPDGTQVQRLEALLGSWRSAELALEPSAPAGGSEEERQRVLRQLGYAGESKPGSEEPDGE